MAQKIVSPGVFTNEVDNTALAAGIANIGGAIVGPFPKGPGFAPTVVTSQADLQNQFGVPDGTYYGPYTAQQYLQSQGSVTIVRVGGLGGYTQNNPVIIKATRGQYQRKTEIGGVTSYCFNGSIVTGSSGNYNDGKVVGTLAVQFTDSSSVYYGQNFEVGNLSGSFQAGSVSQLTAYSSSFSHSLSWSVSASVSQSVPVSASVHTTSSVTFGSASIQLPILGQFPQFNTSLLTAGVFVTAQNKIKFTGSLSGNYGPFDPTTFDSSSYNRSEDLVLAILANTAYDSAQNLWGFDGSTIKPIVTSSLGLEYALTLREVQFTQTEDNSSATSSYGTYNFSLDSGASTYITNVFGTNPQVGQTDLPAGYKPQAAYVYKSFDATIAQVAGERLTSGWWKITVEDNDGLILNPAIVDCDPANINSIDEYVTSFAMKFNDGVAGGGDLTHAGSAYDLREAETPWILSQNTSPDATEDVRYELFKFHTLSDGTDQNTNFKIEITDIKLAGTIPGSDFGSFTVAVRSYTDSDTRPDYLETFTNATLDPLSANYLPRLIGDSYIEINASGKVLEYGNFAAQSKYIRVESSETAYPETVVPFGFEAMATPIGGLFAGNVPAVQYTSASIYTLNVGRYASGIDFNGPPTNADAQLTSLYPANNAYEDNLEYFAPIPEEATIGNNVPFSLDGTCGVSAVYNAGTERIVAKSRRFVLGFQYGFDGQSPSIPLLLGDSILPTNQQGLDCSTIVASGSVGYAQAFAALGNADQYDINLLVTPGINYEDHSYVSTLGVTTCENRGDAFYILDLAGDKTAGGNSVDDIVQLAAEFDTNYAAAYYPWIKIKDANTNLIIPVPPSVVLPAVFAQNDKSAAEWFAPAGLNRGGIPQAKGVQDKLTHDERDTLYEGKVNPIAQFPGQGVVVWGQKTLQNKPSALDRVNVRRLLIALKKFIASSSRYLVFEQNVATTRNRFLAIVNPYLESVQQNSGLYAFKVVMDDTNNTPDLIDRNILYGQVLIQPTRTAEFVVIDFDLSPTGASFDGSN